jgi:hypothetical protein
MTLLGALLGEPFGQDVCHTVRREGNGEAPSGVVFGHSGNVLKLFSLLGSTPRFQAYEIVRNGEFHRLVGQAQDACELAHTVGPVVEHEKGISLCEEVSATTSHQAVGPYS